MEAVTGAIDAFVVVEGISDLDLEVAAFFLGMVLVQTSSELSKARRK